jgi:hypothetical protein
MISSHPPAAAASATESARVRTAALVGFVWTIAALPFAVGAVQCPTARYLHVPCPGCGMTRAFHLLADGQLGASMAMHALAVPTALVQVVLAVASIVATLRFGAPWALVQARWGRVVLGSVVVVMVADVLFWIARALGAFGGPVPV